MSPAAEILERARAAYRGGVANYRDAILETGRLLRQFILARLREGDGMRECQRLRAGITRARAVREAAKSLETGPKQVGFLIVAAVVADLLAGSEGLGTLAWKALYRFRPFVRRRVGKRHGGPGSHQGRSVSESEEWQIRPGFKARARALFAQAVREGWAQKRVQAEVAKVYRPSGRPAPRPASRRTMAGREPAAPCPKLSKAAAGDVAAACMELVEGAESPREVATLLQAKLAVFLSRKKGWWAG